MTTTTTKIPKPPFRFCSVNFDGSSRNYLKAGVYYNETTEKYDLEMGLYGDSFSEANMSKYKVRVEDIRSTTQCENVLVNLLKAANYALADSGEFYRYNTELNFWELQEVGSALHCFIAGFNEFVCRSNSQVGFNTRESKSTFHAISSRFGQVYKTTEFKVRGTTGVALRDGFLDYCKTSKTFKASPAAANRLNTFSFPAYTQDVLALLDTYEVAADNDSWLGKFFNSSLYEDQQGFVMQWFGLHMIAHDIPAQHKALWLYGTGRNGKSVIAYLIETLVNKNTTSSKFAELDDGNQVGTCYGKLALVADEGPVPSKLALANLKTLIAGGKVTVNRKYKEPLSFNNEAIMTQLSNNAPEINDRSDAMTERLITFSMNKFNADLAQKSQILDIEKKIEAENYLLLLTVALQGAREIMQAGGVLIVPKSIKQTSSETILQADNVKQFIESQLIWYAKAESMGYSKEDFTDESISISDGDLYGLYKSYCLEENVPAQKKSNFLKELDRNLAKKGFVIEKSFSRAYRSNLNTAHASRVVVYKNLVAEHPEFGLIGNFGNTTKAPKLKLVA